MRLRDEHMRLETTAQFYLTAPAPCPYLRGHVERKVFTHLAGAEGRALNDVLSRVGFRRSQNIAYRPACDACTACVSVRVVVDEFELTRSFRRVLSRNRDIVASEVPAIAKGAHFDLFRRYLEARHGDGGMADMTPCDYEHMIESGLPETHIVEYRVDESSPAASAGSLVGVALIDRLGDGMSMIYSFYDVDEVGRGLGTHMILDHIRRTGESGLPHLYLGYWVEQSPKMAYKARFLPQERLIGETWRRINGSAGDGAR